VLLCEAPGWTPALDGAPAGPVLPGAGPAAATGARPPRLAQWQAREVLSRRMMSSANSTR
jgi:hypothetical protein